LIGDLADEFVECRTRTRCLQATQESSKRTGATFPRDVQLGSPYDQILPGGIECLQAVDRRLPVEYDSLTFDNLAGPMAACSEGRGQLEEIADTGQMEKSQYSTSSCLTPPVTRWPALKSCT
jgi:hypothetical protein